MSDPLPPSPRPSWVAPLALIAVALVTASALVLLGRRALPFIHAEDPPRPPSDADPYAKRKLDAAGFVDRAELPAVDIVP